MSPKQPFDLSAAHRFFSADCFNQAWELLDKPDRTSEEDEQMLRLNQASLWHWTQRDDCNGRNLSIGYWQASRIHAVLGRADEARRYAQLCLHHSRQQAPFFLAHAYEALARAEQLAGNHAVVETYRAQALQLAQAVADPDDRQLLMDDLNTII